MENTVWIPRRRENFKNHKHVSGSFAVTRHNLTCFGVSLHSAYTQRRNLHQSVLTTSMTFFYSASNTENTAIGFRKENTKNMVNGSGRSKLGQGRNCWQWAKHAWLGLKAYQLRVLAEGIMISAIEHGDDITEQDGDVSSRGRRQNRRTMSVLGEDDKTGGRCQCRGKTT